MTEGQGLADDATLERAEAILAEDAGTSAERERQARYGHAARGAGGRLEQTSTQLLQQLRARRALRMRGKVGDKGAGEHRSEQETLRRHPPLPLRLNPIVLRHEIP